MIKKLVVTGMVCLFLPACAGDAAGSGPASGGKSSPVIGMPNPASVYCVKIGGTLEIRREADGSRGYCHLPDGRVVEEWALYRSSVKAPGG
ncbi:putative hemolysin [Acetobacter musti]|nr:DUF333 domain-containing protein [Acetobacter musti]